MERFLNDVERRKDNTKVFYLGRESGILDFWDDGDSGTSGSLTVTASLAQ